MNKERRKRLSEAFDSLESAKSVIEEVMEEEQEAYDNLPESLQDSERGETMSDNVDDLECAIDYLDDAISSLNDVLDR